MSEKIYKTGDKVNTAEGVLTVVCIDSTRYFLLRDDSIVARGLLFQPFGSGIPESEIRKHFPAEKTYKMGDRFRRCGEEYILAAVGYVEGSATLMCLINVDDGNRWAEPVVVGSPFEVKQHEFTKICAGHLSFKPVVSEATPPKVTYSVGQEFVRNSPSCVFHGVVYRLSCDYDGRVYLENTKHLTRWNLSVQVGNPENITAGEFSEICCDEPHLFTPHTSGKK